jgi:DNA repair protein RAD50
VIYLLEQYNTSIEGCGWNTADGRYLAEGNDRKIRENETSAEELKSQIAAATDARSTIEAQISIIQDELGRSESYRSNINFNILDRGEIRQIKELQDKIGEIDLDSMAKARKEFNIKYKDKMEEEKAVADKVCRLQAVRP